MSGNTQAVWKSINQTLVSMVDQIPDLTPGQVEGTESAFGKVYITLTGRRGLDVSPDAIDGSYPSVQSKEGFNKLSRQAKTWLCQTLNITDSPALYTAQSPARVGETAMAVTGQLVRHFERIGLDVPKDAKQFAHAQ